MSKTALGLAARFTDKPHISVFVKYCSRIPGPEICRILSLPRTQSLLDSLDSVEVQLLIEILDETRLKLEEHECYQEAAYWDLIADRVRHEIKLRK